MDFFGNEIEENDEEINNETDNTRINSQEVFTYHRCKLCPYKTKSIHIMTTHLKRHRVTKYSKKFICSTNKLEYYKCNWCVYKSVFLIHYNKHVEMYHQKPSQKQIQIKVEEGEGENNSLIFGNFNFLELFKTYTCECSFKTLSKLLYTSHYLKCTKFEPERKLTEEKEYEIEIVELYHSNKSENFNVTQTESIPKERGNKRKKLYECTQCSFVTKYAANLNKHKETHKPADERPWFYCDFCAFKTHTKKGKNGHMKRMHGMKTVENVVEQSNINTMLQSDESFGDVEDDAETYFTDYSSSDFTDGSGNKKRNNEKKRFLCRKCPAVVSSLAALSSHLLGRHGSNNDLAWVNCPKCEYKTINKKRLDKHMENYHVTANTRTIFKCDLCNYSSMKEKQLDRHSCKFHLVTVDGGPSSVAKYHCDFADFKTNHYDSLKEHILLKHIRLETVTRYKCELCTYKTLTEREMRTHVSETHVDPQYIDWVGCDICPVKFKTDSELKAHVMEKHIL